MSKLENFDHIQLFDNSKDEAINLVQYKCKVCEKTFPKSKGLNRHMKLHGNKNYKCDKCSNEYSRSDHLKRHLISHEEDKTPFACDFCLQKFSNKSHLRRHLKVIHCSDSEAYRFKCDLCELSFDKKFKLNKHHSKCHKQSLENKVPSISKTIYECYFPFCQRKFTTYKRQQMHMNNMHKDLNTCDTSTLHLQCPFENCYKTYSTNFNLKTHIKTFHYSVKEFKCDIASCNQLFKHKCSVDKHKIRYHNNTCELREKDLSHFEFDERDKEELDHIMESCEKIERVDKIEIPTFI